MKRGVLAELVGVKVEVPALRHPTTLKSEVQRELDRIRRSLVFIEERLAEANDGDAAAISDETVVDQRTVPAPKDLYLRLARQGAFRTKKHGRRVVARWGDVRRALLDGDRVVLTTGTPVGDREPGDGLDGLRERLGLVGKAR